MSVNMFRKVPRTASEIWRNNRRLPEDNPIVVYSMRKVGSTTITKTLRNAGNTVYKQHCIDKSLNAEFSHALSRAGLAQQHWVNDGRIFRKRLEKWRNTRGGDKSKGRLKVFSFVKDPLAVALSDYFMHVNELFPAIRSTNHLDNVADLVQHFRSLICSILDESHVDPVSDYLCLLLNMPAYWFERELRSTLDIDVLKAPFDTDKGYTIYRGTDADLALIRTDCLSRVGEEAIGALLGEPATLQVANVAMKKRNGDEYEELVSTLRLPSSVLDEFYGQAWLGHCFLQPEIAAFKQKWSE